MTTTTNPFEDDPEKAEVFELGYFAGLSDPLGQNTFQPFSPELLDVYSQGTASGREDANASALVPKSEIHQDGIEELVEHVSIEAVAHLSAHIFKRAALGLIGVLLTVLFIPGDVQLRPLEDDFGETYTGPDSDANVTYVAACPRVDHPMVAVGVTSDGYWAGVGRNDFGDALRDALEHGHSETLIARCSLTDNTCGPVWIAHQ